MARKYQDFDDQEQDGAFDQILSIVANRKREFVIASVSAAVILLGLIAWGSSSGNDAAPEGGVPIVRADAGDYKTTPENPGGMEIPYRDSTVFSSNNAEGGTENILVDNTTEEPVPRSQLFAGLNTEGKPAAAQDAPQDLTAMAEPTTADEPAGEVEQTQAALNKTAAPSNDALVKEAIGTTNAPAAKTAKVEPVEEPANETIASAAPVPAKVIKAKPAAEKTTAEKVAKTEPAAGAATAAKAVTPGGYYIQVGSVRSESGAGGEWKKIQAKYSGLGGLKYRAQEANLGAKGTFYRIQAGPMSKESATSICSGMKSKTPGACLVTK